MSTARPSMSVPDAGAKYYGVGRNKSYELADQGLIPAFYVGRKRLVSVELMKRKFEEVASSQANAAA